jgi:subtilisin family serine protease
MRHHKGVVLVAAAGNDTDRAPFWPAAAPFAVSVGALNRDMNDRADYSNVGGWVDVYVPGTDIINAFPRGDCLVNGTSLCQGVGSREVSVSWIMVR